jgi:4'-phosphopantetheinyl transferase
MNEKIELLKVGEIQVYWSYVDNDAEFFYAHEHLLDSFEKKRFEDIVSTKSKLSFLAGRVMVKIVLGSFLDIVPEAISLKIGKLGKPELSVSISKTPFQFNLSSSAGLVVLAVGTNDMVGIDIEKMRSLDIDKVVRRFFTATEADAIYRLIDVKRGAAFFALWTLKEAYIKAVGRGLHIPLDSFSIYTDSKGKHKIKFIPPMVGDPKKWLFFQPEIIQTHRCAVAIKRDLRRYPNLDFKIKTMKFPSIN